MKTVVILTPYAAPTLLERQENELYARRALADSLVRGEAPFASALLYTQVLDDSNEAERALGTNAGLAWLDVAGEVVVYVDRGVSYGMSREIVHALRRGYTITARSLSPDTDPRWVDEVLAQSINVRDLFIDTVLQLPPRQNAQEAVSEAHQPPQAVQPTDTPVPVAAWSSPRVATRDDG